MLSVHINFVSLGYGCHGETLEDGLTQLSPEHCSGGRIAVLTLSIILVALAAHVIAGERRYSYANIHRII
jgi:hypothetical protein